MADRFVFVDWGFRETVITVYERVGFALTAKERILSRDGDKFLMARRIVELCNKWGAWPYVDVTGPGESLLNEIRNQMGPDWMPSAGRDELNRPRIRQL